MEEQKSADETREREIIFSRTIKAGKRIYYIDVKRTKKDELYLSLTESKKIVRGQGDDAQFSYEKHKIFLYREDFEHVLTGLQDAVNYIEGVQGKADNRPNNSEDAGIKLDIEF